MENANKQCCPNCGSEKLGWNKVELQIGNTGIYKDLTYTYCEDCGDVWDEGFE